MTQVAQLLFGVYHKQLLITAAEGNVGSMMLGKCAAWFCWMQSLLAGCLRTGIYHPGVNISIGKSKALSLIWKKKNKKRTGEFF